MLHLLHHFLISAASNTDPACHAVICSSNTGIPDGTTSIGSGMAKIMHLIFSLMGSLAVVVVIIGGLQYVLSAGDPKKTAQAKETILYAVIGILISLSAYAIVTFVAKGLG